MNNEYHTPVLLAEVIEGLRIHADGIYVDGGTQILIEGNIVHHNNIGIEIACEHSGRTSSYVTCRNNIVYLSTGPGISIGGMTISGKSIVKRFKANVVGGENVVDAQGASRMHPRVRLESDIVLFVHCVS